MDTEGTDAKGVTFTTKIHESELTLSLGGKMKNLLEDITDPADLQKLHAIIRRRLTAVVDDFATYILSNGEDVSDMLNQEAARKGEEDSAVLLDMALATRNECMR
jgi:hypothetical protein